MLNLYVVQLISVFITSGVFFSKNCKLLITSENQATAVSRRTGPKLFAELPNLGMLASQCCIILVCLPKQVLHIVDFSYPFVTDLLNVGCAMVPICGIWVICISVTSQAVYLDLGDLASRSHHVMLPFLNPVPWRSGWDRQQMCLEV